MNETTIQEIAKKLRNIAAKASLEGIPHLTDEDFETWAIEIVNLIDKEKVINSSTEASFIPYAENFTLSIPNITVKVTPYWRKNNG